MKKLLIIGILVLCISILAPVSVKAQCSICTRTAQQMGDKPARGLNMGILYLAFTPLALMGIVGYRWYKRNHSNE
jgi:hypothetical protein